MVEICVPQSHTFYGFDFIVDAFGESVGLAFKEVIENLVEPVVQGDQERLERFHIQRFDLLHPDLQSTFFFFAVLKCIEQQAEQFFQLMTDYQLWRHLIDGIQFRTFLFGQVFLVFHQDPKAAIEK